MTGKEFAEKLARIWLEQAGLLPSSVEELVLEDDLDDLEEVAS